MAARAIVGTCQTEMRLTANAQMATMMQNSVMRARSSRKTTTLVSMAHVQAALSTSPLPSVSAPAQDVQHCLSHGSESYRQLHTDAIHVRQMRPSSTGTRQSQDININHHRRFSDIFTLASQTNGEESHSDCDHDHNARINHSHHCIHDGGSIHQGRSLWQHRRRQHHHFHHQRRHYSISVPPLVPSPSSSPSAMSTIEELQRIRNEVSQRLMDTDTYPVGSMSIDDIQDAEVALDVWVSDPQRNTDAAGPHNSAGMDSADTREIKEEAEKMGLKMSFMILQRLIAERTAVVGNVDGKGNGDVSSRNSSNDSSRDALDPDAHDRLSVDQHPEHQNQNQHDIYSYHQQTIRPYIINRVVDKWRRCWRDGLADIKPDQMLAMLERCETEGHIQMDNRTYTLIVDGMILKGDPMETSMVAQWLLDRRLQLAQNDDTNDGTNMGAGGDQGNVDGDHLYQQSTMVPDTAFITTVMDAWANSGQIEAPDMAETLLDLMHNLGESGHLQSRPNVKSYAVLMKAYSLSTNTHLEKCSKLEEILWSMDSTILATEMPKSSLLPSPPSITKTTAVVPDRMCCMYVINAWANANTLDGAQRSWELLQGMTCAFMSGNDAIKPHSSDFASVMMAFAHQGELEKVDTIHNHLYSLHVDTQDDDHHLESRCEAARLLAACKSRQPHMAQAILDGWIAEATNECNEIETPNSYPMTSHMRFGDDSVDFGKPSPPLPMPPFICFVHVMSAWKEQQRADMVENVLRRMIDLSQTGHGDLLPDNQCFKQAMKAWHETRGRQGADAPSRCEDLLRTVEGLYSKTGNPAVKPKRILYDLCFMAWSRSTRHDATMQAQRLMNHLEERNRSRNGKQHDDDDDDGREIENELSEMIPTRYGYTSLMLAWRNHKDRNQRRGHGRGQSRSRSQGSTQSNRNVLIVERLFETLQQRYAEGDTLCSPDLYTYTVLAQTYAEDGDHQKIRNLIDTMWRSTRQPPNSEATDTQNADDQRDADAKQARSHSARPDSKIYNILLTALSKSRHPDAPALAEDVICEMENEALTINRHTVNAMITVYTRSDQRGKRGSDEDALNDAEKAEAWLRRLGQMQATGTTLLYQNIINAWTKSNHPDAARRSELMLNEMLEGVRSKTVQKPTDMGGYRKLLVAISKSKIHKRNRQAKELLHAMDNQSGGSPKRGKVPFDLLPDLS